MSDYARLKNSESQFTVIGLPKYKSELCIPGLVIPSEMPMPNWFRRFWYWALLGWTWKPYKD